MKKLYSIRLTTFFLFLLTSINTFSQTTYNIDNPEKLEDETYVAGDVIILKNGVYSSDERIKFLGNGTAEDPITFRAETPGGVIFTGGLQMNIGGDYVIVDGFHWKGGYGASNFIQFRNSYDYANYSTIQNCAIDGLEIEPGDKIDDAADGSITKHRWIVLYGTHNTVINCSFMNKESAGALILAEYAYNASPDDDVTNTRCDLVGHTISNNYFYKYAKIDSSLSNAGDSETIRIGTSEYQNVNSGATVSNNYFVEADGENEIITNKSKNNTYINNTFRRCRGSLVLRHGSNATVDGNYFLGENIEGTGGIRITDSYHTVTNNYIQDCIATVNQAKWNNGITFIGGGDNAAVDCNSTDVSNGYQKTTDINVSNNTIMNTNAPLYYNTDKGSTDPLGNINNNLIYFSTGNSNLTDVISGEYAALGTALTYNGNVFNGTDLGVTNGGFSKETGITAAGNGEVYSFSGADGKGADLGAYTPTTDDMVGKGIGACFLDYSGANINDGECTIVISESLTVGSLPTFTSASGSEDVSVYANVSWTAVSNDTWIAIDTNSGTGNATVLVSVTENVDLSTRIGTVTFTQDTGGDDIVRTLTINQEAADATTGLLLINDGSVNDNVVVYSVFHEEVTETKNNVAVNSLDKDTGTQWSGNNDATEFNSGTNVGEIIYDLGGSYDLQLVNYMSTNGKIYEFKILVSSTTTDDDAFTNPFGAANLECSTEDSKFTNFMLPSVAIGTKYIKIIGYGQPAKPSTWNTIVEIEFYGAAIDANGDEDGDGIMNDVDKCPNTPIGEVVDVDGCSDSQLDNDDDDDGVMNDIDQCDNTTAGANVNEVGCFTLLSNNFKIETIGETCTNKENGKLIITAVDALSYTTTINGAVYSFTNMLEVDNLEPKTYEFCISVEGESFEQCFSIVIESGIAIAGKTFVTSKEAAIEITQGSAPFNVYLNGEKVFQTMNKSFSVDVLHGDLIEVKTDVICEGVFLKKIDLVESIVAYPNPTKGKLTIGLPIDNKQVTIELYNMQSQLISSNIYNIKNEKVELDIENIPTGIYLAKVILEKPIIIKIVKQ